MIDIPPGPTLTTLSLPAILQQELERRCAANPRYSLRALALNLGTDHSTLSQVIRGRRALTGDMVERLATALGLTPLEASAVSTFHHSPAGSPARDADALLVDPLHFGLMALSRSPDFRAETGWMADRLHSSLDAINIAVTRLLRLGLLRMAEPGRWQTAPMADGAGGPRRPVGLHPLRPNPASRADLTQPGVNPQWASP